MHRLVPCRAVLLRIGAASLLTLMASWLTASPLHAEEFHEWGLRFEAPPGLERADPELERVLTENLKRSMSPGAWVRGETEQVELRCLVRSQLQGQETLIIVRTPGRQRSLLDPLIRDRMCEEFLRDRMCSDGTCQLRLTRPGLPVVDAACTIRLENDIEMQQRRLLVHRLDDAIALVWTQPGTIRSEGEPAWVALQASLTSELPMAIDPGTTGAWSLFRPVLLFIVLPAALLGAVWVILARRRRRGPARRPLRRRARPRA